MKFSSTTTLVSLLASSAVAMTSAKSVKKEVCVVGGGAAGAYTAYELQKRGYDTVLFEPQSNLGGNCEILEFPSTMTPDTTYSVNAAVIIFSPRPAVLNFFNEFGATTNGGSGGGGGQTFVYGPGFVFPVPPQDPLVQSQALQDFATIAFLEFGPQLSSGIPVIPEWENLSSSQVNALLEPFGDFLVRNPAVAPLRPLISALMQGFGFVDTRPMWEVLAFGGPPFITQLFTGTFLRLDNGCQEIYDELQQRMLTADPDSVKLGTYVDKVKRRNKKGKQKKKLNLRATDANTGSKTKYKCDDIIVAFRPNGVNQDFLKDITHEEQAFFDDLDYNGYIPSVWAMDLGPDLVAVGANQSQSLRFSFFQPVDVGIISLSKDRPEADYPWRLFYQPAEPADTPAKLQAVETQIIADLTALGFVNVQKLFLSNHVYAVKPQSEQFTLEWNTFFDEANSDGDQLFWTGSVPAGEGSENVWEYSWDLMEANFPSKIV